MAIRLSSNVCLGNLISNLTHSTSRTLPVTCAMSTITRMVFFPVSRSNCVEQAEAPQSPVAATSSRQHSLLGVGVEL